MARAMTTESLPPLAWKICAGLIVANTALLVALSRVAKPKPEA
jgi:hypothetical protein